MRIIGLTGKARTGKDTVAAFMEDSFGFTTYAFADPLRQMLRALGVHKTQLSDSTKKELVLDRIGRSPRYLMRTLGTRWGRDLVHPELWVILADEYLKTIDCSEYGVQDLLITDVRFANEAEWIRRMGGSIWELRREGAGLGEQFDDHGEKLDISEDGLPEAFIDAIIENNGTLVELYSKVEALLEPPIA